MSAYASVVLASACGALLANRSVSLRNKGRQNGLEQRSRFGFVRGAAPPPTLPTAVRGLKQVHDRVSGSSSIVLDCRMVNSMEITNVMEYEAIAKQKLPKMVFDYYASGAEDQWSLKENREAFSRILFRPRILIDVSRIDMTTTVLGFKISMPIMIAPTAMQKMAHPEEYATARAASAAGTIMGLDLGKMDKVSLRCPCSPSDLMSMFLAQNVFGEMQADDSGLASYVAGQIDRTLSWKVVKAAQGRVPVLLDGGVRRGTDVFKALALGASGVFIGRPVVFSLAAEGEAGIRNVLQMLRDEFELTMALSGCTSLKEITRNHIVTDTDRNRPVPRL
ncbi:hypothetical protein BHE74_00006823 [Ensete ventricosum]|nr:hypothetical protein BHE74_00006823 [Ensete ventricosum]